MTAYVCVRKLDDLRRCIDHTGTQADVAAAAGLSTTRLSQICVGGKHAKLAIDKAMRLERTLGVPLGHLFVAIDASLLAPYIDTTSGDPCGAPGDTPDSEPAQNAA